MDGREFGDQLRDEFGNYHFGMTAAARGYTLGFALTGAGIYQTFRQDDTRYSGVLRGANPITAFVWNSTPRVFNASTSAFTMLLGRRNSGMP